MARASWLNDDSHPDLDAHLASLDHFAASLAEVEKANGPPPGGTWSPR